MTDPSGAVPSSAASTAGASSLSAAHLERLAQTSRFLHAVWNGDLSVPVDMRLFQAVIDSLDAVVDALGGNNSVGS